MQTDLAEFNIGSVPSLGCRPRAALMQAACTAVQGLFCATVLIRAAGSQRCKEQSHTRLLPAGAAGQDW